jgi:hypothetical protein
MYIILRFLGTIALVPIVCMALGIADDLLKERDWENKIAGLFCLLIGVLGFLGISVLLRL